MNFFALDIKKLVVAVILVGVTLLAINMQRNPLETPWFARPFTFVGGMIQSGYAAFTSGVRGTAGLYLNLVDIKKHNIRLINENAELRAQLGALTELKLENERLNQLLDFRKKSNMELLAAKVIGRDSIPDHNSILINRGSQHGVVKGMASITVGGVVGQVAHVEKYHSQILLLTDRYSSIDTIVQRSRARGIVQGISKDRCRLAYLQRSDDVTMGDLLVTSGLNNIFPKGFPVGTVSKVKKSRYGVSQEVDMTPTINPFTLEEVYIVLNAQQESLEQESGSEPAAEPEATAEPISEPISEPSPAAATDSEAS